MVVVVVVEIVKLGFPIEICNHCDCNREVKNVRRRREVEDTEKDDDGGFSVSWKIRNTNAL